MGKKYMKRKHPKDVSPSEYLGLKRLSYGEPQEFEIRSVDWSEEEREEE